MFSFEPLLYFLSSLSLKLHYLLLIPACEQADKSSSDTAGNGSLSDGGAGGPADASEDASGQLGFVEILTAQKEAGTITGELYMTLLTAALAGK